MMIPLGFLGVGAKADFELISSQVLSATGNVTFASIPQGYKHLQLRMVARDATASSGNTSMYMRFNGATGSSYTQHQLVGNGSGATSSGSSFAQTSLYLGPLPTNTGNAGQFIGVVADILDYTNANKYSTLRSFSGTAGSASTQVGLYSGVYMSLAAVSQIDIFSSAGFVQNSRFSLYGVRG